MKAAVCAEGRSKAEALFRVLVGTEPPKRVRGFVSAEGFAQFRDPRLLKLAEALGIEEVRFWGVELAVFLGLGELWDERRAGEVFNALAPFDALVLLDEGLAERLIVADLEAVERLLPQLEKRVRAGHAEPAQLDALSAAREALLSGKPASSLPENFASRLKGFNLLTAKPLVISGFDWEFYAEALELGDEEIIESFGDPVSQFWEELRRALGIIHFFTVKGGKATAWALPAGSRVIDAAAQVHTDMARGFAAARAARWEEVAEAGDFYKVARPAAREAGVSDGDVLEFKFSR